MEKLRQGTRDFSRYLADFVRLMTILEYGEEARKYHLERGLSTEMLTGLKYQDASTDETLEQFEARLRRLDDRIRRDRGFNKPQSTPVAPRPAPKTPSTATGTHPGPMDLSASRKKLTPEEKSRRMAEGLCLYCGGSGHMARECPNRRPLRAAATAPPDSSVASPPQPSGNDNA